MQTIPVPSSCADSTSEKNPLHRPDIGDPQFPEWFHRMRGEKDLNLQAVKNLCIASLIMAARDLLNASHSAEARKEKDSAQYWIDHPEDTTLPFSFCCYMIGIQVPTVEAQHLFQENRLAIASLNMPNTGFPLDCP